MTSRVLLVLSLLSTTLLTGCIQEEVRSELVLEADGRLTWIQSISAVRSDAEDPVGRAEEEAAWLSDARAYRHPAVLGLELLGAGRVRQQLLRDRPPMEVRLEAEFASIEDLGRGVLALACGRGQQSMETLDGVTRWTLRLDAESTEEAPETLSEEEEAALIALAGSGEDLTVSLARGRFVDAQGFELSADHRRATLVQDPEEDGEGDVVLTLAWDLTR